eukprot:TRINITY_DN5723_c0_g1_i10.p1 TRINITY_DN5723_c0_g1~~TRINITY_DN5723_c0_g1_i10.p1  ORF type:complete len:969 (-),score=176.47 TRINITY_DN5723_c0_g1_i10:301-3207(-)
MCIRDSQRRVRGTTPLHCPRCGSRGAMEQGPTITLKKLPPRPTDATGAFRAFAVSNHKMVIATDSGQLVRIDLRTGAQDVLTVGFKCGAVRHVSLDPIRGVHIVVAYSSGETFYLSAQSDRPVQLKKLDGLVVTSLAWDRDNKNMASTGELLIGTDSGAIYEAQLENHGKSMSCRKIYDIGMMDQEPLDDSSQMAIHGLHYDRLPADRGHERKFLVMASTLTRHYHFVGGPTLEQLFRTPPYNSNPPFKQMPGHLKHTELHLFTAPDDPLLQRFAWLTEPGVVYGGLHLAGQEGSSRDQVFQSQDRLRYPEVENEQHRRVAAVPISMGLTRYHFLLLYPNHFQVVNPLSKQMVYETPLRSTASSADLGSFQSVGCDVHTGMSYLLSDKAVIKVEIAGEELNMWRIFLGHKKFRAAKEACRSSAQRDKVLVVEADYRFEHGDYVAAAQIYAQSPRPFEEVALKFIQIGHREALIKFLTEKLRPMRENAKIQRTLICTWLTELFLDELNQAKFSSAGSDSEQHTEAVSRFRCFLEQHHEDLDPATTESLISSHGRIDELVLYANHIGDHSVTVGHYIQRKEWERALDVMSKQQDPNSFYKHTPVLMRHVPAATVSVLLQNTPGLDPVKLIPALIQYESSRGATDAGPNEAIRYLQMVCKPRKPGLPETVLCKDMAVNNYLLSLYAKQPEESELLEFLELSNQWVDLEYALRLCLRLHKFQSCIKIYSLMGKFGQAVAMALQWDTPDGLDLAKVNANRPETEEERRQHWLAIAKHMLSGAVQTGDGVKGVIKELAANDLVRIEDILPFLPKDTLIDDFCHEICTSLEDYNKNIERLKREMTEATNSSSLIQQDLENLPNRFGYVHADQRCGLSGEPLLDQDFYLFPCGHAFLVDRAVQEVKPFLTADQRQTLDVCMAVLNGASNAQRKKDAQDEMDELVGAECMLCSDMMVDSIVKPFEMLDQDQLDWDIN